MSKLQTLDRCITRLAVRRHVLPALLIVVVLIITGCHLHRGSVQDHPPETVGVDHSAWASPYFATHRPRRVLILHCGIEQPLKNFSRPLANAVAAECRNQGLFEVIVPQQLECRTSIDEIERGVFFENELVQLAKQHNADAIMLFRVNEFRFYSPMKVSATFVVTDAREAIMVYSQDEVWNLGDRAVFSDFESFLCTRSGGVNESLLQIQTQSPTSFAEFIALDVASTMTRMAR